jgi:prepilin-type N-terminal cleavage/methylation domain-containing protein
MFINNNSYNCKIITESKECNFLYAFTLAEVLITLLIVGVISSLVIPGIIADTQETEFKTAWKKTYSVLNQATLRLVQDNGGTIKGVYNTNDLFMNAYCSYLNCIKVCAQGTSVGLGKCWSPSVIASSKYIDGTFAGWSDYAGAILNDGTQLRLGSWSNASIGASSSISVDVNGFKGPNTVGKDVFYVWILSNTIKPWGTQGDGYTNDCNTSPPSGYGYGCSARYCINNLYSLLY